MPLNTGEMVEERYRVVKLLGQGGMGAVYRAWDMRLNRPVALKEMTPQSGLDVNMLAQLRQQFQQEAQILASLVHTNLVRVTDHFSWGSNEYLVMDFVEGESMAERIQREGAQPEAHVLAWAGQLLGALAYCHERGVIHRDIKPQNIIITPEGKVALVDFGLVKLWNAQDPRTRTVMRGAGTPEYAPPEQYDMGMGHTDPRSDIYGLGATLYHAITGQAPPTATQRMASPACFAAPRRINATISPGTEAAILKAMGVAMEHRFQSTGEMAQALGGARQPSLATPHRVIPRTRVATPPTGIVSPPKRKRGTVLGLGGVGLAVVGVLCLALAVGAVLVGLYIAGDGGGGAEPVPVTATPSPTATSQPHTATPTTAAATPTTAAIGPGATSTSAPEIGGILFQDDFSDSSSGWDVWEASDGALTEYAKGRYRILAKSGGWMWGRSNQHFADAVIVEVDATLISGPANDNAGFGVACMVQSNEWGDGYAMVISGDGYYSIQKVTEGDWDILVEWSPSKAINQGNATNHIRAVCDGSSLTLIVNGELLAEVKDTTYSSGDVSLEATTFEDEPAEIHFDDLVVYAP